MTNGLDTQRFDQKINYNYISRFNFWLSLIYPLVIVTRTPFKDYLFQGDYTNKVYNSCGAFSNCRFRAASYK